MKRRHGIVLQRAAWVRGLPLALAAILCWAGCGPSAQERAYEQALSREATLSREEVATLIPEYRRIVQLAPGTACARQAESRAAALEAQAKAEELHKAVFQEHGVD